MRVGVLRDLRRMLVDRKHVERGVRFDLGAVCSSAGCRVFRDAIGGKACSNVTCMTIACGAGRFRWWEVNDCVAW
jgi:hypothetical protein